MLVCQLLLQVNVFSLQFCDLRLKLVVGLLHVRDIVEHVSELISETLVDGLLDEGCKRLGERFHDLRVQDSLDNIVGLDFWRHGLLEIRLQIKFF